MTEILFHKVNICFLLEIQLQNTAELNIDNTNLIF